jgi:DNA-binding protein HU-beta
VADKAEMSRSAAARAVDAIFNTASGAIAEAVDAAGHLSIPGFGKFTRRTRAARTGRNPRTGALIDIPERTSVSFTPGRGLRNLAGEEGAPAPRKTAAKKTAATKTTAKKATAKKAAAAGEDGAAKPAAKKAATRKAAGGAAKKAATRAQKSK